MNHPPHALLVSAAVLALVACKEDEPAEADIGHAYFPVNIGHWVEYHVDSIRQHSDNNAPPDTVVYSFDIREELVEQLTDNEGRPVQRILRTTRDGNGNWIPKDVWWQAREQVRGERTEENMRRVKLYFPPRTGTRWNTNARNTDDAFEIGYTSVDQPYSVNGLNFENTVTVEGTYPPNPFITRNYRERWAKGVGLIEHEVDSINDQHSLGYNRFYVRYTITAYGDQ
ncbi:MAG TPA: hypothetical protein PJ983_13255 [Flavobacteriales bacterium]|nr:hypothetical protein [Flavobacteriales bacterium]HMW98216.1 hypothetical protein [Flavobacteriales bacterium]